MQDALTPIVTAPPQVAPARLKQNLLIAYPYFKKDMVETLRRQPAGTTRLIVDSGAFTAWNTGRVIQLDDYCRFLDSISCLRPFNAVQLDVFGDPEGTYKNFLIMKQRGYDVMPVFTRGDTVERLDEFYQSTDYIMFGGITIGGKNQNYMKWFLRNNKGRKAHWLGFCKIEFLKHYKPHSCDSSTWNSSARFGITILYGGQGNLMRLLRKVAKVGMPPPAFFKAALHMGLTPDELLLLQKDEAWTGGPNDLCIDKLHEGRLLPRALGFVLSAMGYSHFAHDCEKNIGTHYYVAVPNNQQLRMMLAVRAFQRLRKVLP